MKYVHLIALGLVAAVAGCDGDSGDDLGGADTATVDPADSGATDTSVEVTDTSVAADTSPAEDTSATPTDDTVGPLPDVQTGLAIALDDLCAPLAESTCQVFVGCRAGVANESVAACRAHAAATCEASLVETRDRIAVGAISYDAEAAHACLTRVAMIACDTLDVMLDEVADECADVFAGTLTAGAACADAGDCADGLYCAPDAGGACPGTCQPEALAGELCDSLNTPCAEGSFCELGECVPDQVALGAECAITEQCPVGSFCDDAEDTAHCRTLRSVDGVCGDDDACADGLFCSMVDFAETGVCLAQLAPDAACTPFVTGAQCAAGQACDMESELCVARPDAAGDPCVEDWQPCGVAGLWCDYSDTTCRPEPKIGEACGSGSAMSCQYGFCTAEDTTEAGTCLDFTAPDAACTTERECGGFACVAGTCAPPSDAACHLRYRGLQLGPGFRLF